MSGAQEMISSREAFGLELTKLGYENPKLIVLDADLATSTKTSIFAAEFPERFVQMGVAEQNMIGVAAGLALAGWIPVASTFACFASKRALDQIRTSVAQPGLNVKIVGAYSGILAGKTGITHQSVEDMAIFRAMPHMTILAPSDGIETRAALRAAVDFEGPVYIRTTRDPMRLVMDSSRPFKIGEAVPMRDGRDVALITTGWMLLPTLDAVAILEAEGIQPAVLHVPTIKPFDEDAVEAVARRAGAVVTVEDHSIIGGLGSAVAETLSERHPTLMRRVGLCDCYAESAPNEDLLVKYGLTAENIAATAREVVRLKQPMQGGTR